MCSVKWYTEKLAKRTEPAPNLTLRQRQYVQGYSFQACPLPRPIRWRLLPFLPPQVVFSLQIIVRALSVMAIAYAHLALTTYHEPSKPVIRGMEKPLWPHIALFAAICLITIASLIMGRASRRARWSQRKWPTFAYFVMEEGRLQILGFLETVVVILLIVLYIRILV